MVRNTLNNNTTFVHAIKMKDSNIPSDKNAAFLWYNLELY